MLIHHQVNNQLKRTLLLLTVAVLSVASLGMLMPSNSANADITTDNSSWLRLTGKNHGFVGDDVQSWKSILQSSDGSKVVLVGGGTTDDITFISKDSGQTWREATIPTAESVHWTTLKMSPDGNTLIGVDQEQFSKWSLFRSTDAGDTWEKVVVSGMPTSGNPYRGIANAGSNTWVMGGMDSSYVPSLFTSTDNGLTWSSQPIGAGFTDFASGSPITASTNGTVALVGADESNYRVFISQDFGETWTKDDSLYSPSSVSISPDGQNIISTAYDEEYSAVSPWISSDLGETWQQISINDTNTSSALSFINDSLMLGVAQDSGDSQYYFYSSNDLGQTWTQLTIGAGLNAKYISSSMNGLSMASIVSLDDGSYRYYTSFNGGVDWTDQTVVGYRQWKNIKSSADGSILIANTKTDTYISTNGGVSWSKASIPDSSFSLIYDISISNDGSKLAVSGSDPSYYSVIYNSTDGGDSWNQVELPDEVQASDWGMPYIEQSNFWYIADDSGALYISNDFGQTWLESSPSIDVMSWLNTIDSSSDATYLATMVTASDYSQQLIVSSDSGATWTAVAPDEGYAFTTSALSRDGQYLLAVSVDGDGLYHLMRSTDLGESWVEINTGIPTESWWQDLHTAAGSTFYVKITDTTAWTNSTYFSSDAGLSWVNSAFAAIGGDTPFAYSEDGSTIATTNDMNQKSVYVSSDSGQSWSLRGTSSNMWTNLDLSANGSKIFASNDDGFLYTVPSVPSLNISANGTGGQTPLISTDNSNPQKVNSTIPEFYGVSAPLSSVTVTVHSDPVTCMAVSASNGSWACALPSSVPIGIHSVMVEVKDLSTNVVSMVGPFYIDVTNDPIDSDDSSDNSDNSVNNSENSGNNNQTSNKSPGNKYSYTPTLSASDTEGFNNTQSGQDDYVAVLTPNTTTSQSTNDSTDIKQSNDIFMIMFIAGSSVIVVAILVTVIKTLSSRHRLS